MKTVSKSAQSSKKLNIAFAWWGTGGHVTPISSLISYAQSQPQIMRQIQQIYRFGSSGQLEQDFANKLDNVQFVSIKSGKLRRYWTVRSTLENLRDVAYFNLGYVQSLHHLRKNKIDVIFCKWWYVALPVSFAAASLRIPIIVHESDMSPGLTNKLAHRLGKQSFVAFSWALDPATLVWQILSPDLLSPSKDLDDFGLAKDKKTLLVMCGSQWSAVIFDHFLWLLDQDKLQELNIMLLIGKLNAWYKKKFEKYINVQTYDFLDHHQLAHVFGKTDLALTRGSATTLSEMEEFGIAKVIVPLPSHDQPLNAKRYADKYGDIVVDQKNISAILDAIQFHLDHPRKKRNPKKDTFFETHQMIRDSLLLS